MPTITIRNIDESLKNRLRISAARNGCSMEEEVRRILRRNLMPKTPQKGMGSWIHQRFRDIGLADLPLPARSLPRQRDDLFEEK